MLTNTDEENIEKIIGRLKEKHNWIIRILHCTIIIKILNVKQVKNCLTSITGLPLNALINELLIVYLIKNKLKDILLLKAK